MFVADFETTTEEQYNIEGVTRVWGWGICEIENDENVLIGHTLEEFMEVIQSLNNPEIYFHNVGFDITFIFDYLLNNGWRYSDLKEEQTFNGLISENNEIYQIEMIQKVYKKSYKKITFYDSWKKIGASVERAAKGYGLEMLKGEIDYDKYRPIGYVMTDEERRYIEHDVRIVAKILKMQFEEGMTAITTGADALSLYKDTVGRKVFNNIFPILDLETDAEIRQAYKGGFTWVNPKYQGKTLSEGSVYDVNSLYPWAMRYNLLPIGNPERFVGEYKEDKDYPLYIQRFIVDFKVKEGHIPTIQIKGGRWAKDTEYITETKEPVMLYLSNVDFKLFLDHHEVFYIEYIDGYKFKGAYDLFNDYIDPLVELKNKNKGTAKGENAKLRLNSLYGKFATDPDVTGKSVELNKNGVVSYVLKEQEFRKPIYTAMGVFITAYAREKTIRTAQQHYDRFVYADTDSIHLVGIGSDLIEIDKYKLGYWDHEYDFVKAKYVRAKMYYDVLEDGSKVIKGAGIPEDERQKADFDNYDFGYKFYKLKPKRVKGGTILIKELNEVKFPEA